MITHPAEQFRLHPQYQPVNLENYMVHKKPPYTHRQMAELMFKTSGPFESKRTFVPVWLKIEAYTLFFTVLPHLITLAIWVAIAAVFYGAVLLI
jgi:hypothetical protein